MTHHKVSNLNKISQAKEYARNHANVFSNTIFLAPFKKLEANDLVASISRLSERADKVALAISMKNKLAAIVWEMQSNQSSGLVQDEQLAQTRKNAAAREFSDSKPEPESKPKPEPIASQTPARESQVAESENILKQLKADAQKLLDSGLLNNSEIKLLNAFLMRESWGIYQPNWETTIANFKRSVEQREEQGGLLKRLQALLGSQKLVINEKSELEDLKDSINCGENLSYAKAKISELEKKVSIRKAGVGVDAAFKELLAPENAKFLPLRILNRIKDLSASRHTLASDWVQDRVAEAYAELQKNKGQGNIVDGAYLHAELIERVQKVIDAKAVNASGRSFLQGCILSLQGNSLQSDDAKAMDALLSLGESVMKQKAAQFEAEKAIVRINALLHAEGDKNIEQHKQMLTQFRGQILSDPASVNLPDFEKLLDTLETPRKMMGRVNALLASGKLEPWSAESMEFAKKVLTDSPTRDVCATIAKQLDFLENRVQECESGKKERHSSGGSRDSGFSGYSTGFI